MQVWAGLRGAVGLSLSLFVLLDNQIEDLRYRTLSFFFMGMMVSSLRAQLPDLAIALAFDALLHTDSEYGQWIALHQTALGRAFQGCCTVS